MSDYEKLRTIELMFFILLLTSCVGGWVWCVRAWRNTRPPPTI